MNQWLRRGALGCVIGLSVLAAPTAAFAYGPGGAGNGFGLSLSSSVGVGGATVTVSAATGPCIPGTVAQISLIRAIPSQTPALLGTSTVSAAGGIDATTVVIPTGSPVGVYILFSTCSGGGGTIDVFTASYVVDGPILSGTTADYAPPSSVSLSPKWGTPATRAAVQPALTDTASQVVSTVSADGTTGSSGSTSSGSAGAAATGASSAGTTTPSTTSSKRHLVAAGATRPGPPNNHLLITWLIVAAVVVGLSTTGLLVLRRRRPAGH